MKRKTAAAAGVQARIAGVLYLLAVAIAVWGEVAARGRGGTAAVLLPVFGMLAMTLLLYGILAPVNRGLAVLMMLSSVAGLTLEAVQWQPGGVNVAMLFHALYCLLVGLLVIKSIFLPRILGGLMAFAGLVWLINLAPSLADHLSPYDTILGLLGETALMLWLVVMGVNSRRWTEQAGAVGGV